MKPSPLRRLLLRESLLVVGLGGLAITAVGWWGARAIMIAQAKTRAEAGLKGVERRLNASLQEAILTGEALAQMGRQGQLAPMDSLAGERQLLAELRSRPSLSNLTFVLSDGQASAANAPEAEHPGFWVTRGSHLEQSEGRPILHLWTPDNQLAASLPDPAAPRDWRERPWVVQGLREGHGSWTAPYLFLGKVGFGLTYTIPVAQGLRPLGVLGVDLVLGDIRPWLNEAKPTPGTRLAVLGGDGRILVPPEQEHNPADPARARMLEPATLDPALHPMPFAVHSAKGAERAGLWPQIRIGGQTCLVQRRRLRLQGAPDWELLVAIPEADLLGEPRRVALITLLCSLGAFGVLAWRMVWSSHQIADPLERLAAQTGALVEGHAIVIPATPISELQDLAQTLRAASLALEERKLLEDQLRVAQRREMIGTLAAGVAHDLGNLLSVAGTNLELAQEPDLAEPDRARSLDRAAQALRRSQAFLRALLAVGKPGVVEPRAVDLAALVRESGMMLEPLLGNLVAMRIVCHGEALFVHGDALQLEQVLLNLAVNGRDAMPRGGALTLEAGRDGQGRPYLAVSDEGEGVPPAIRDQLFLPFFTTKGEGKGSGLGLAMVQGIARSHGATVEVASEPGQGSRFTLRFPVADGLPPTAL